MELFLYVALGAYVASAAMAAWHVLAGAAEASRYGGWLAGLGFLAHTAFLIAWGVSHGRLPAYAPFEALFALLWCAVLGHLVLGRSLRSRALSAFVMPLVAIASLAVVALVAPEAEVTTARRDVWLPVHAVASLVGAADFFVAFAVAVMYLLKRRLLKHKTIGRLMERLPSLEALDRLNYRAIALGVPVFTFALVSGVVLAVETGPGWWANWMVQASFVAWLVFAVLLHVRLGAGLRGPKVAYLTILGFLLVAGILCGIAFVGDTLHKMRPQERPAKLAMSPRGLPDAP
jgi:ABC-type transport system involved in cytochrome c biogenesis permease subunit